MEPLSLLRLQRVPLPVITAAASLNSRRQQGSGACLVPRRRRRGVRLSSPAVTTTDTPRTGEAPSPSPASGNKDDDAFDWFDQWYPIAPVDDLEPGAPHGKTVLGLRVVAWHDRSAGEWRVFDDACPHRLAPLSEGRIDGKGRLQCVYHGWCFDGAGACQFIPQAPALGPPVHKNAKACVASYPCVVQNRILWFYPRTEPEYKDVLQRKRPPYIPEIDDPSYVTAFGVRDLFYGYDILVENIVDPGHLRYAHKGLLPRLPSKEDPGRVEHDQEGGDPMDMKIEQAGIDGFKNAMEGGNIRFMAPCTVQGTSTDKVAANGKTPPFFMLVAFCVPVGPGRSRLIWGFPTNVGAWLTKIIPRWFIHISANSVIDSDAFLLHLQERKYAAAGLHNWHNASYVPTSSGSMVVAFRSWFRKYCKNQIGWAAPQMSNLLPPTPTKVELLERYWSHVVQCTSCSAALKAMKALEVFLQVASVAMVGFLAVANETLLTSAVHIAMVVCAAVLCFIASRWLANFIEKSFYFQDYVHAYK